jgi:hypothetical protein
MNTGLWNMASGFAAARRPGMTGCCVLFVTRQKERPPKAARLKEKEAAKGGPAERKGGRQRRPGRKKRRPPKAARPKEKEAAKGGLEAEGRMPMRAARSAEERVGRRMPDKHR